MTTMTQPLQAGILTAPIAAIDRRSLSQAWYSALHVPSGARALPSAEVRACGGSRTPVPHFAQRRDPRPGVASPSGFAPREGAARKPACDGIDADRRAPRSALARKIERAFAGPCVPVRRATLTVGEGPGSRVHVALQTSGGRVRLVALCSPSALPAVSRALAQARFALAGRGVTVEALEIGATPCS